MNILYNMKIYCLETWTIVFSTMLSNESFPYINYNFSDSESLCFYHQRWECRPWNHFLFPDKPFCNDSRFRCYVLFLIRYPLLAITVVKVCLRSLLCYHLRPLTLTPKQVKCKRTMILVNERFVDGWNRFYCWALDIKYQESPTKPKLSPLVWIWNFWQGWYYLFIMLWNTIIQVFLLKQIFWASVIPMLYISF